MASVIQTDIKNQQSLINKIYFRDDIINRLLRSMLLIKEAYWY